MVLLGEGPQMEAQFGLYGDSATLDASAQFLCNIPYAWKSIWTLPIELLDVVCHMESCFDLFGDTVSFGAR